MVERRHRHRWRKDGTCACGEVRPSASPAVQEAEPENSGTTILEAWPKPRTYRGEVLRRKGKL